MADSHVPSVMPQDRWRCPEAITHGPADGKGKCPWCGRKISAAMSAPMVTDISELTEAYGRAYDPDYDSLTYDQIRRRYQMGQDV